MEESRRGVSPGCEEFLAAILDKPNPADGAAFAAAVLREYNPDEPRDAWGRWTTGGSSGGSTKTTVPLGRGKPHAQGGHAQWPADRESDKKSLQDMLRSLGPTTPTPTDASADANSAIFGMREFTSKSGTKEPFNAQFAGFDDDGHVKLKKADGTTVVADPKYFGDKDAQFLNDLAKLGQDKRFVAGLKAKPNNVHLDSTGIKSADQIKWEAQVIRDIGKLSELESGRGVLGSAKVQGKEITVQSPRPKDDNHVQGGTVYYDPARPIGARAESGKERPPFIGLGQELHNAVVNLAPGTPTTAQREEGGLRTAQDLRSDYNDTIRDPEKLKQLTDRYPEPSTGYPGWGSKEVDERVLGLDGRPLRRRRDR